MTLIEREIVQRITEVLNASDTFHVQAQEQDSEVERITVSYGGDRGVWFTVFVEFDPDDGGRGN